MPLGLPPADNRRFDSLMSDARARIPRLSRTWTDHNAHDPGITLLELLAWLTETDLFRAGRETEANRRAFLRWFGLEPREPTVARTVLGLAADPNATASVVFPADSAVTTSDRAITFTTSAAIEVQPVTLVDVSTSGLTHEINRSAMHQRRELFAAFGPRAATDDALYLNFKGKCRGELQLYFWTGAVDHDDAVRERLQAEASDTERDRLAGNHQTSLDWRQHYSAQTVWEVQVHHDWLPVRVLQNDTRALTLSGVVRLAIDTSSIEEVGKLPGWRLRCRIARGHFECSPNFAHVVVNAVPALHQGQEFTRVLDRSNGRAEQTFRIKEAPLVMDATRVSVTAKTEAENWALALDWDQASPDEPTAVLEPVSGELRFGNGRAGLVPVAGAAISITSRSGGGAAGNVDAGNLVQWAPGSGSSSVTLAQPFAARGGAPAETIADLQARLMTRLARPTRAVSLLDIEQLARETPGVPVGRVRAIPAHHPDYPGLPASGCVTVVVIPQCDNARPEPTQGMLTAVCRYLERRRPVGTELQVTAPLYTTAAVQAQLHVASGSDAASISANARARINAFFHPLTGGPEATGWAIGRNVYRAEILALLQDTPGVKWVDELLLWEGEGDAARSLCGNVIVCPTSLIAAGNHELTVSEIARTR